MPEIPLSKRKTQSRVMHLCYGGKTVIAKFVTEMAAVLEQRREKTRALRQAMMQELLTGRTRLV
jgi:hypothetical protein